jgi:hypothetical protein
VVELLDQPRAVGAKPLREYMEVEGYSAAARWVYGQALDPAEWSNDDLINLNEVRRIHFLATTPVWTVAPHPDAGSAESPGGFREHEIAAFDGGMKPPSWTEVPALLSDWIAEVLATGELVTTGTNSDLPLPEQLAKLHHSFECIHPFTDGNGRTGRLALNLVLVRLGYPPVVIFKKQWEAYLRALQRSDDGDHGALGEIIARAMLDNLNRFIVPSVAGPARLVPLAALADDRFSIAALRQAAQRGRLDAMHGSDGIWRSSRKAVLLAFL